MTKKSKVKKAEKHKSVGNAKEQLENIERSQQKYKKRGYPTKIGDISKSKQNCNRSQGLKIIFSQRRKGSQERKVNYYDRK